MESVVAITEKLKELYTYIESSRSLARQSKTVDCYFKLQGTVTKFIELYNALQEHFSVPSDGVLTNDNDSKKVEPKPASGEG